MRRESLMKQKGAGSPEKRYTRPLVIGKSQLGTQKNAWEELRALKTPRILPTRTIARTLCAAKGISTGGRNFRSQVRADRGMIFVEWLRNFRGARLAAVAFRFATCGGQITLRGHKIFKRGQRLTRLPMHRIGDTFIGIIPSCFFPRIAVSGLRYPLHLVAER